MANNNSDKFLITALSEGDEKAFDAVFLDYFPKLKCFIQGFVHSEEEAENIAQDVFMNLWIHHESLADIDNLNAYIYRMAKNAVFHTLQKNISHQLQLLNTATEIAADDSSAEEDLYFKELLSAINVEVEKMPEQRQRIFKMSRFQGLNNDEIATHLNISKRTVETHISAALSDLRKVLPTLILIFINRV